MRCGAGIGGLYQSDRHGPKAKDQSFRANAPRASHMSGSGPITLLAAQSGPAKMVCYSSAFGAEADMQGRAASNTLVEFVMISAIRRLIFAVMLNTPMR